MKLRRDMDISELRYPLPFFYMEKKIFLQDKPSLDCEGMFCKHGRFHLSYYDVYPLKKYKNLLYPNEYKNIETSLTLKPERLLLR